MSISSLITLLKKLKPLFVISFDLPTSTTPHHPFLHFTSLLTSCHSLPSLKQLHTIILTTGYHKNLQIYTKILSLACSLSPTMDYARKLFDQMPQRDVFVWNTLIRGYSNVGPCQESIILYKDMCFKGILPDNYTFPFVLRSCSVLSALWEGREVHCNVIKYGFESDVFVQSSLISLYAQSGGILDFELVFDQMRVRNIVSWTSMIAGYVQNGIPEKGLQIFLEMVNSGILANAVTLVSVLPACARLGCLELGMLIHGYSIKLGVETDVSLGNAFIAFYGKCGLVDVAWSLFDQMKEHSVVSWNAIITAYEQNDFGSSAIKLFHRMLDQRVEFDYITVVTVISACASLGALDTGKWVHELVKSKGLECNVPITNALIDMYAKCGSIESARDVFDSLPNRSVVSWSSIIGACASHGHGRDALEFFSRMKEEGMQPNSFTFTAVLTACRHSGLVEEGKKHFESMRMEYSIMPGVEQCACMVDLLGRAGLLLEAFKFIENMPIEPDADVWGALLGACRIHGNLEMAEYVADRMFDFNPQTVPFYILMKNIYAEAGRWDDVARLKFLLEEMEVEKIPGKSSVEINQRIHTFLSGSRISNFSRDSPHEYVQL
ncbi:unnamed protein product [Withania somnifera]